MKPTDGESFSGSRHRLTRPGRLGGSGSRFNSPWSLKQRLGMLLWRVCWTILCRPTPKPFYRWRGRVLRLFGAQVSSTAFVAANATIQIPWNVRIGERACVGDKAVLYSLGTITLGPRCTVAQESYLCAGTHDFGDPELPLLVGEVEIGAEAFIGARAFVLPGVHVGEGAVVGAGSVVTVDVEAWMVAAGNPCVRIRRRPRFAAQNAD